MPVRNFIRSIERFFQEAACAMSGGHRTVSYTHTRVWVEVDGQSIPVDHANCTRCHWRGFRTTWGTLLPAGIDRQHRVSVD